MNQIPEKARFSSARPAKQHSSLILLQDVMNIEPLKGFSKLNCALACSSCEWLETLPFGDMDSVRI